MDAFLRPGLTCLRSEWTLLGPTTPATPFNSYGGRKYWQIVFMGSLDWSYLKYFQVVKLTC